VGMEREVANYASVKNAYDGNIRYVLAPNIIRVIGSRIRWAGHVVRMGATRNVCKIFVGKPEGKRSLGRPRSRWKDNIRTDRKEM